jgi:hypothetical protein
LYLGENQPQIVALSKYGSAIAKKWAAAVSKQRDLINGNKGDAK